MNRIDRTVWVLIMAGAGLGAGYVGTRLARTGSVPNGESALGVAVAPLPQKEPAGWVEFVREAKVGMVVLETSNFTRLLAALTRIEDAHSRIEDEKLRESVKPFLGKWHQVRTACELTLEGRVTDSFYQKEFPRLRKELAPLLAEIVQKRP